MFPLLRRLKSAFLLHRIDKFGVLVFAVLFAWEVVWEHCFADDEKTAFHEYFDHWWEFEMDSVECCLETKMRRDVKLLYDVMADTIRYIQ